MTERRKDNSQKILDAAFDLVAEVGISGLRTRDIAEKAGVNLATLHYCFAGKDALLEALYHFIVDQFRAEFRRRVETATSPEEMIRLQVELRVEIVRQQPRAVTVWRAFMGEAWTNEAIHKIIKRHLEEQRERTAAILEAGRVAGQFAGLPTDDTRLAASMLLSLYEGLQLQGSIDPEAFDLDQFARSIYAWLGMTSV